MDSKSIALRGIGVQVPSLVPPSDPGAGGASDAQLVEFCQDFALGLLPALVRRVGRLARQMDGLAKALDSLLRTLPEENGHPEEGSGEPARLAAFLDQQLAEGPEDIGRRTGWCSACLGTLSGFDLLLTRREAFGPLALVELLLEAQQGPPDGNAGSPVVGEYPETAYQVVRQWPAFRHGCLQASPRGQGFELALCVADLVRAACQQKSVSALELSCESSPGGGARLELPLTRMHAAFHESRSALYGRLLPGSQLAPAGGCLGLALPPGWLAGEL